MLISFTLIYSVFFLYLNFLVTGTFCYQESVLNTDHLTLFKDVGLTLFAFSAICCSFPLLYSYGKIQIFKSVQTLVDSLTPASVVEGLPESSQVVAAKSLKQTFRFVEYKLVQVPSKTLTVVTNEKVNNILVEIQEANLVLRKYFSLFKLPNEDILKDGDQIYARYEKAMRHYSTYINYGDWTYCSMLQERNKLVLDLLFNAWNAKSSENCLFYYLTAKKTFSNIYISHINLANMLHSYLKTPTEFAEIKPLIIPASFKIKTIFLWDEIFKARTEKVIEPKSCISYCGEIIENFLNYIGQYFYCG